MQLEDWRATGHSFRYRGYRVFYRTEGCGEALLCLHGFPTASWDWHRLWPHLTQRFRVIAPDFLGFGFSDKPRDYPYSIFDQATLAESLLCALGIRRCHVLAHDYGDTVAQELLARYIARKRQGLDYIELGSVCLLNGGLFPEAHRPLRIQRVLCGPFGAVATRLISRKLFCKSFARVFAAAQHPSKKQLDEFWRLVRFGKGTRVAHRVIRYLDERVQHRSRWVGALQQSPVPLRLICGLDDPVSGAHIVKRYRQLIPKADVLEFSDVGHYPQLEAPEEVLQGVLSLTQFAARAVASGTAH
jgi:pimeloyl-ACP methyl ester carboxylesterase